MQPTTTSQVENDLGKYGLNKDYIQILALVTETLGLAKYMKGSLASYLEDEIDKSSYVIGATECFNMLIDKIKTLSNKIENIENEVHYVC